MRTPRIAISAALALACAVPATAELLPDPAGDLPVAEQPSNQHHRPALALVRDGWLGAWDDEARGLMVRRFDNAGVARGPAVMLAVNDALPALPFRDKVRREAHEVAIAARADGSFLAVWVELKLRHSADGYAEERVTLSRQVLARVFTAEGRPASRVWNLSGRGSMASRPVVALAGDRFVVAWQERGSQGAGIHVRAVRPDGPSADQLVGPRGLRPAIAAGGNGLMVTWERCCGAKGGYRVFARRLDRYGFAARQAFEVSADLPVSARVPAVAGQPGGSFLVVYQRTLPNDYGRSLIYGQLVSRQGDLIGGELVLSGGYGTAHTMPVAAALGDDGWAVGWLTWVEGFRVAATIAAYGPLANATGTPVDLNEMPIVSLEMALAAHPDGRLVGAWEGFDTGGQQGLRARLVRGPTKIPRASSPQGAEGGTVRRWRPTATDRD